MAWVANEDKTRWFLVMRMEQDAEDLLTALLVISNQTVVRFGQPPLYAMSIGAGSSAVRTFGSMPNTIHDHHQQVHQQQDQASRGARVDDSGSSYGFHVSIGWILQEPSTSALMILKELEDSLEPFSIAISSIKVKMGNTVNVIPLSSMQGSSSGIIPN